MTAMTKTYVPADAVPSLKEKAVRLGKKIAKKIALYIPATIVFAFIALYYIQLSHMGA